MKEREINDLKNNQTKTPPELLLYGGHEVIIEAKRQYDAIDRALEVNLMKSLS